MGGLGRALYIVQALVHFKEVIILHSDVVGDEVYPIEQLNFDDELKGLFLKIDVSNINVVVKYQKMHGCKTWIGTSKRVVAAESNEKMNKRFKALVHSKQVIILHSDVVGDEVYPIEQLDFDNELKGLFLKIDVRNTNVVVKYKKMHGCKTWIGSSKRIVAAESNEEMTRRFKALVHFKQVLKAMDSWEKNKKRKAMDSSGKPKKKTAMDSDWENLPKDLLDLVLERLESISDYLAFSVVCKAWNGVAKNNRSQSRHTAPMLLISSDKEDTWNLYNALVHSKEVIILHSDVVGEEVYPIEQLDFDDELKGLFLKIDGLVHSKEVIILHSDVVGDEVYPIDQLDFDGEMKGLFLKIDRGGDGKFFCRLCGMCWPDLAARNEHEVEHLSKFDVSCFLISGNCLNLSLNDRNNISCKKDLLSWIESVPDGVVLGDLADVYVSVPSDLKELIHSKEIVVLYSNVVGGEVVYPIKQLEFDDELKSLFKQFDVRNIDAVNKYLRMHGSKTWTGSSKRPADARESRKLNKRSLQKAESVNRCTEDVFEVFLNLIEDCCSLEGHCRMLRA
ncbi:unnamed protein product [Prunus armeniaca]|uniref:F-box domain-containing protein n=1 Tax=Prunus armeniaca TaxID=36596 RepID=A0A6J5UTC7_PRUAR|nr:unnamed protein product [Prunus armeniaca]